MAVYPASLARLVALGIALAIAPCLAAAQDRIAAQLDELTARHFVQHRSGGVVLVARRGQPIFRHAYGYADVELGVAMRPDHVLGTGSLTKQFTAVAVLQLVDQGRIALGDDVRQYLPKVETHGKTITIEQLLTHTSGLPNIVDLGDFEMLARQDYNPDELIALTKELPLHFEPGAGYRYSDSGYFVLGALIEKVSGLSYSDYLETKLFRPLGMYDTWYADQARVIPRRARGYTLREGVLVNAPYISMTVPYAAGAVSSTVDDLNRWDVALRSGSVVSQELLQRAWKPRRLPDGTLSGYGFGWQLCTLEGHPTIEHGGFINGFQARLMRLPADDLTIAVLVNNDADAPYPNLVARRLARYLLTGSPEARYQTLNPAQRASLIGRYSIATDDVREVFERDGELHARRNDRAPRPLAALSPTELTPVDGDAELILQFELGADGRATKVRTSLGCEPLDVATRIDDGR